MEASRHLLGDQKGPSDPRQRQTALDADVIDLHPREGLFLDAREIMPREMVEGIGRLTCVESRFVQAPHGVFRQRQMLEIETDFGTQYVRRTLPGLGRPSLSSTDEHPQSIVHLPGFTEMPDAGTAMALHDQTAVHFPNSQLITIGTDGVSRHGPSLGWREGVRKRFGEMAATRRLVMRALCGNDTISIIGTSMGTILTNKIVRQNIDAASRDDQTALTIMSLIKVSHALVPPERVWRDIGLAFVPHIAVDSLNEAIQHPNAAKNVLAVTLGLKRSAPAMTGNLVNLRAGTHTEKIESVARTHPTGYLLDAKDPLCQRKYCQELAERYPETVQVRVRNKGHASSLDAHGTAQEIAEIQTALVA